jgi:hypothetical protein
MNQSITRQQFGYEEGSPLENVLIEQILVCYVNLYVLEINSAGKLCESHSTETGLYWDRRLTGAQRRFRRACETLARVKKLSRNNPALQFNIATIKQLNAARKFARDHNIRYAAIKDNIITTTNGLIPFPELMNSAQVDLRILDGPRAAIIRITIR